MVHRPSGFARAAVLTSFFCFCLLGCALGLSLCLVKTPQGKAEQLAQAGAAYFMKAGEEGMPPESADYLLEMSRQALVDSLMLDAYSAENWKLLSTVLESQGRISQSIAVRNIVASLDPALAKRKPGIRRFTAFQLELTQLNPEDIGQ